MGDFDLGSSGSSESSVKYHSYCIDYLTVTVIRLSGQFQRVSLTGAVSSQIVTEEFEGWLIMVGNHE